MYSVVPHTNVVVMPQARILGKGTSQLQSQLSRSHQTSTPGQGCVCQEGEPSKSGLYLPKEGTAFSHLHKGTICIHESFAFIYLAPGQLYLISDKHFKHRMTPDFWSSQSAPPQTCPSQRVASVFTQLLNPKTLDSSPFIAPHM